MGKRTKTETRMRGNERRDCMLGRKKPQRGCVLRRYQYWGHVLMNGRHECDSNTYGFAAYTVLLVSIPLRLCQLALGSLVPHARESDYNNVLSKCIKISTPDADADEMIGEDDQSR